MAICLDAPMGYETYDICVYLAKRDKLLALGTDVIKCVERPHRKRRSQHQEEQL